MYNNERKIEYLKDISKTRSDDYLSCMNSMFNKTEPFEEMFGKDLCDFSRDEISTMYSMFQYGDKLTYNTFNSNAKYYVNWCDERMYVADFRNHFSEFCLSDYEKFIDQRLQQRKYVSRSEIYKFCSTLPNPRDAFVMLSLYEFGKSKDYVEILNMRLKDIDIEDGKAKLCTGRIVNVPREYIEIAIKANTELSYYFIISNIEKPLIPSEFIFKMSKTGVASKETAAPSKLISRIIKRNMETFDGCYIISPQSLAVSGQFDMIRRRSEELGIDNKDYVFDHFDELRKQYNMIPNTPKMFYQKYKAYL